MPSLPAGANALIERISIELTDRCAKACHFCYNRSNPGGAADWDAAALIDFVRDCARNGVRDASFGGGEPLQYPHLMELLHALRGLLHRSITTNGLGLDHATIHALAATGLEKAHVSIHFPANKTEVGRVIDQARALAAAGIRSGVNLLVSKSSLAAARTTLARLVDSGIGMERIILLPMRLSDVPSANDIAHIAAGRPFQSTSCLKHCRPSPRFVSIDVHREVAWCSYTRSRRRLPEPTWNGLVAAVQNLPCSPCAADAAPDSGLQ